MITSDPGRTRPTPNLNGENDPFWQGAVEGELRLQRCGDCGRYRYPISSICPDCLSSAREWQAVSGLGTVFASVVFHKAYHPAFEVPYNVSIVQLDEGPRMFSNVVGVPPEAVAVGARVRVAFEKLEDGAAIPVFELAEQG